MKETKIQYLLHLADNALILGQRLGEWCGHGPVLEQDIAMTNISLDYIGRARLLYQYAAELQGPDSTEDQLAFLRDEWDYKNCLLVEHPNVDFAYTVARQFFMDAFQFPYFMILCSSNDKRLSSIAEKTVKETAYHLKWSAEWMIRLGDGTEISNQKIQIAVNDLWSFTGELFESSPYEDQMIKEGIIPDISAIKDQWFSKIQEVFERAHIVKPSSEWMQTGGKSGQHTEQLGYILASLQYMQRAYPGLVW
ncbi:MAG: phenylacetate-CoA oxygenase subunit PaaC [Saprospiraceae bacterium]|nr:phenylacetate-CoA oxygenase subunit PaaC [Saprospiraceae bacterium]